MEINLALPLPPAQSPRQLADNQANAKRHIVSLAQKAHQQMARAYSLANGALNNNADGLTAAQVTAGLGDSAAGVATWLAAARAYLNALGVQTPA